MKNEKRTVLCSPFSYENEKRMKFLKIQRKNLLNIKMVVNYLNFVFLIEVKAKSKYWIFEFRFSIYQKHEMALWVHRFIWIPNLDHSFLINALKQQQRNYDLSLVI